MLLNRFQIGTKKIKEQKNSPSALEGEPKFIEQKISYKKNTIATKCDAAAKFISRCHTRW